MVQSFFKRSNASEQAPLIRSLVEVEKCLSSLGVWDLAKQITHLRESLHMPELRVVVFGEFSRGKSTLINALIGRVIMPAQLIPTTGHITRIVFGTEDKIRVHHSNGHVETGGLESVASFSSLNIDGAARENIDFIEIAVNSQILKNGMILIDTPGVNDRDAQTRRAKAAIAEADIVIFLLDARQLLGSAERELAADWMAKGLRKPLVPVVNFINFIEEDDRTEIIQVVENWSSKNLDPVLDEPWFVVDARGALKHALGEGPPSDDDFHLLGGQLVALTKIKRERLQKRSRYGQLLSEISVAGEDNDQVLGRIRDDAKQLERDRAEERERLQHLSERFDTTVKLERDRLVLYAEAKLRSGLQQLEGSMRHGGKESVKQNGARLFEERLHEAVTTIEREADQALAKMVNPETDPPARLAIWERLSLDARVEVGDLPVIEASGGQQVWGAVIGAGLGTLLLPGFGTGAGLSLGRWIAQKLGETEPDYGATFCDLARTKWEPLACRAIDIMRAQYDARTYRTKARLQKADEADNQRTKSLATEMEQRDALKKFIDQCRHQLEAGLATAN
jgi:GTPase SAR1 family protein